MPALFELEGQIEVQVFQDDSAACGGGFHPCPPPLGAAFEVEAPVDGQQRAEQVVHHHEPHLHQTQLSALARIRLGCEMDLTKGWGAKMF